MAADKRQTETDWKDGFLFLGNHLALDFLNTRLVQDGEAQELLRDFDALLRWFRSVELLTNQRVSALQRSWGRSPRAQQVLEELRRFREDLRKEVLSFEGGADLHRTTIDKLNTLLAAHPMIAAVKQTEKGRHMGLSFVANKPEDLFAPLAQATAELFTKAERSRVRKCGQCVLQFLDTSKKGTRRWCSMRSCGNRLKVAAYARRKRLTGE
jgi:predicted RNA-binding Zn ribbon-like protein